MTALDYQQFFIIKTQAFDLLSFTNSVNYLMQGCW